MKKFRHCHLMYNCMSLDSFTLFYVTNSSRMATIYQISSSPLPCLGSGGHTSQCAWYVQNWRQRSLSDKTSSSAIGEGPRDALSQLKACQLLHNCTKNHIWLD